MPYSIRTKDGIVINNIPDSLKPDAEELKLRVTEERAARQRRKLDAQRMLQLEQDQAVRDEAASINPVWDTAKGMGQVGLSMVAGAGMEIAGGLAGLAQSVNPFAEEGAGARTVKWFQDRAYRPGEEGQHVIESLARQIPQSVKDTAGAVSEGFEGIEDATLENYGPLAATVVHSAPTALLEAIPGGAALRKGRQVARAADTTGEGVAASALAPGRSGGHAPEPRTNAEIASDLSKGRAKVIAEDVVPDQRIVSAAESLGVELNPSHYSQNRAYIETEQALKSRPNTKLSTKEQKAISDLGAKADELIQGLGGSTDIGLVDLNVRADLDGTRSVLQNRSTVLYNQVEAAIPKNTRVDPAASRTLITAKLDELGVPYGKEVVGGQERFKVGDVSLLTTAEKELLRIVDKNPTYAALDRIRRNIGEAIGKNKGPYKDDDSSILGQLYAALSEDQGKVADSFGVGDVYQTAKGLVAKRKDVEDQIVGLFGRDVAGSMIPKMLQSTSALTKGDVSKLRNMMELVPEKRRQEVAASMLANLFSGRSRKDAMSGSFATAYEALNRNPSAKDELFRHLPHAARERFDALGIVATGLYRAKALENTSRTAAAVIQALEDGGIIKKVTGFAGSVAAAEGISTMAGFPLAGTAGVVTRYLTSKKTPKTETADELLTSNAFRDAILAAGRGDMNRADRIMDRKPFKDWLTQQSPDVKKEIAQVGFIGWLVQDPVNSEDKSRNR